MRCLHIIYILINSYIKFNSTNLLLFIQDKECLPRLELIKTITKKIEYINIVYIKIFQILCLNDDILFDKEKDYLLKYTDSVPFLESDIDYNTIDILESKYNIEVDINEILNSGIISVVFKGIYKNKKVVIKIIKNDINRKIIDAILVMEIFIKIISIIPNIRKLNLKKCILDNKELLLEQTNFIKEVNNIQIFKEKNSNNREYIFPECYPEITNEYNNVIVMENIKGLTYNDIKDYDDSIKQEFGKLLIKFGFISILYNSAIHCDIHPGNLFFYINKDNSNKPKYQIGFIDFGIITFPSRENQNYYYTFFKNIQIDKEYDKLKDILYNAIIEEKDKYLLEKNKITEELILILKKHASDKSFDFKFFFYLSQTLNSYGLSFCKEFNQLCLSLQVVNSLAEILCKKENLKKFQDEVFLSFNKINKLLEIE
tara:strand:+ start:25 stop:1311 length:1287 start_codon:yes stop_codon:yes gene_type:complete